MINSVIKAVDILQLFSAENPIQSLSEISRKLGYPKTTVHNLLNTLELKGFIEKTDGNHYAIGTALVPLTQAVRVNVQIRDRAAPLLRELGDFCGVSVYLTVLDGAYSLYIYAIESSDRLQARSVVGDRTPMHCTGVGKAMLAFLPGERVRGIVAETPMIRFTNQTITDLDRLFADLEETKKRGYSLDFAEHEENTYCVGSPIFNERGQVIASCSVSGSKRSLIEEELDRFAPAVLFTAQEISRRMGFVPTSSMVLWRDVTNPMKVR
jgi:DNA-binding IclR family transcriptional regulator